MENISNEKIEKVRADLVRFKSELSKSKARTAELHTKIRDWEKQLETLVAFEIAARYYELIGNEDFAAQLKANQNKNVLPVAAGSTETKEDELNVNLKKQ
ncbi:hypothetical protein FACS1894133_3690 [Clostridia bacterium]|nr:hypothetical protein FACS1894133_3690 [Clostridia bacterium]